MIPGQSMPMSARILWLPLFAVCAPVGTGQSQDMPRAAQGRTITIADQPICAECRIELTPIVTLGNKDGEGILYQQSVIASDRRGRYYVSSNTDPTIVVFDGAGRFIRKIGRRGQGPGEFQARPFIYFADDTLYAADIGRITIFAPDYKLVRTIPLGTSGSSLAFLGDGTFVIAGTTRSGDLIGFPMHLVGRDGKVIRSFGSNSERQDIGALKTSLRTVAPSSGGRVWSADPYSYLIERWNSFGGKELTLRREAAWFPPNVLERGIPRRERPPPRLRAVQEQADGILLTMVRVPDRDWQPQPPSRVTPGGATYTSDSLLHKLYDSVIEAIDPVKRAVLTRRVLPENVLGFVGPGLLASYSEDGEGSPRYVISRIRVITK